jgi:uncharacterized protein YqhQ
MGDMASSPEPLSPEPSLSVNGRTASAPKVRLGGMALRNGLLVHGPEHWAVAVRSADGRVLVASGPKPRIRGAVAELPGLRGIARLMEAFAVIPLARRERSEARLPFEDTRVLAAIVASSALSAAVRRTGPLTVRREAVIAALGFGPAAMAMVGSDLAAYHAVEHKEIAAYEQDADPESVPKEHGRCGSTLIAPMVVTTAAGNLLARSLFRARGPLAGLAVTAAAVAVSVEMFAWSERHSETALAKAFRWPGFEIQRLFATREPTREQMEVGRAAMGEILRLEA